MNTLCIDQKYNCNKYFKILEIKDAVILIEFLLTQLLRQGQDVIQGPF